MHTNTPEFQMVFSMFSGKKEERVGGSELGNELMAFTASSSRSSFGGCMKNWKVGNPKVCNILPEDKEMSPFKKEHFEKESIHLGGGNSNISNVHPEPWGR